MADLVTEDDQRDAVYIGDGVYVKVRKGIQDIEVFSTDGIFKENVIYFDIEMIEKLYKFAQQIKNVNPTT